MPYIPNTVYTLSIIASAMGFILAYQVFSNRKYLSNLYLSFVLLFLSLSLLFPDTPNLLAKYPLLLLTGVFNYLYGPCMFRYVYHTFYSDYPPRFSFGIHSIPAAAYSIFCLFPIIFLSTEEVQFYINETFSGTTPFLVAFFNFLSAASLLFYTAAIIRLIFLHRNKLKKSFQNPRQKGWFLALISVFIFMVGGGLIYTYAETYYQKILKEVYLVQILGASVFMIVITFFAVQNPTLLTWQQVRDKISKKLNLSNSQIKDVKKKIINIMENEKLYLDETLTLRLAANQIKVHPNVLSFVINDKFGKGFKQFVNEYRCDYFIELLNSKPDINILHLAYEAGFPSKTTFHEVFNKKYNTTPTQYRQNLIKKQ
ncbi:MAG: helix-turn-helix domain-containing protein [Spirochaetia bacterium]|nr:helix-turn-helix domain-containing protein [Spirochaetia bacterium]